MDRPLDTAYVAKRTRSRWTKVALIIAGVVGAYLLITGWISPSVSRNDIRTAKVYSGIFEATLSASGTVMPEFEEVLTSPAETRLLSVLKRPGEMLARGTRILELDMNELKLSLDRIEKDLTLKTNQRTQAKLDMDRALSELKSQLHIKELRLNYAKSKRIQSDKMFSIGAISRDQLDQAVMDEEIASIDRTDLEKNLKTSEASYENQLKGLDAEVGTLRKERDEIRRELEMLACTATREGLLTWTLQEVGASIHRGDPIARIASQSGYRVDAQMSDVNASRIAAGQPVRVRINETYLDGTVGIIYPTIENGVVKFTVNLADKANALLRSNLRVDLFVVLSGKTRSLLVEKGPFATGEREQPVFVIRGDKAVRSMAQMGGSSFDLVEIASGVSEGDEIIISDMKEYHHVKELRLR